jgi:signal transduction histidine kinase
VARALGAGLRRLRTRIPRLPAEARTPPPVASSRLVSFIGVLTLGAGVAAGVTIRPPVDGELLVLGGCVTFAFSVTAVRTLTGGGGSWSTSVFAHLGLSLVAGPAGAVVAALSEAVGHTLRFHSGWLRSTFNAGHDILGNLAAWACFNALTRADHSLSAGMGAGLLAGAAQYATIITLLVVVRHIAEPDFDIFAHLRRSAANVLPYHLGAGCTAFAGLILVEALGDGGFVLVLVPVALLQGFLLVLASRTQAGEAQREAHARERELLLRAALEASDAERQRIRRDLHDGVVQDLAAAALGLRNRAGEASPEAARVMQRAADATAEAMEELRTLLRQLAPPDLENAGLAAAIDELAAPLRAAGVGVQISISVDSPRVGGRALVAAYRIAREALRNVAQHAEAAHLLVTASLRDGGLDLEVTDDGIGFSEEERRRQVDAGHVGLVLLRDVAREAGGELTVESAPPRGTRLRAWLPVDTSAVAH